jgi:prevent-host-death family protein
MKTITPTELRANIYKLLDEVLETGLPLEIKKGDQRLRIVPVEKADKFQNLIARPGVIQGDPDELVAIGWEHEVKLDLP